ncbi:MAG: hypothetical protein CSA79_02195 [Thiothrix nivea]|nr:MAG: hypothetical protein CSA79_02195 [Thiothrix nivea]
MNKHYLKKALTYSTVGSLGLTVAAALQGCGDTGLPAEQSQNQDQAQIADAAEQGLFMVIQQTGTNPDTYELAEKYPSAQGTRAILKDMDGNERILSEEELKQMAEAEAAKVESGESQLAGPVAENQGLSLGETILASAAGALIGGMLANKLMGNSNFQKHQQRTNQRAQSSMSSSRKPGANNTSNRNKSSRARSGFFGGNKGGSRSSSRSFGG